MRKKFKSWFQANFRQEKNKLKRIYWDKSIVLIIYLCYSLRSILLSRSFELSQLNLIQLFQNLFLTETSEIQIIKTFFVNVDRSNILETRKRMTHVHIFKHPKYSEVSSVKSSFVTLEAEELLVIGWLLYFCLPYASV